MFSCKKYTLTTGAAAVATTGTSLHSRPGTYSRIPISASMSLVSSRLRQTAGRLRVHLTVGRRRFFSSSSLSSSTSSGSQEDGSGQFVDGAMLSREESRTYKPYSSLPFVLRKPIRVNEYGHSLMQNPLFNKGTSFNIGERDRLGIRGLIPSKRFTMQQQIDRATYQLRKEDSDIRKYVYLRDLQDRNETLFHRVLLDNIEELAPIVYTPTVGQACLEFGSSFRRSRGMYFSHYDEGDMASMMYNWPGRDVHVAVITDGGRVLGLGDLGANGMAITIGKLALYCSAGGIAPHRVLPIMFDAGTDNVDIRNDPFYLGQSHSRLKGQAYYKLLDELIFSLKNRFPNIFIQFEDFSSDRAMDVLNRYRYKTLCFNDDIQGTGAVAVAGILSALEAQGKPADALKDQKIVVAGSGSAGLGVVNALVESMVVGNGISEKEARSRFWVADIDGVLGTGKRGAGRAPPLTESQMVYARDDETVGMSIEEVVSHVKPTLLIGLSTVSGLFSEKVIRHMAATNERPIIFPLSNPTSSAECTAEDAYHWTDGRCIFGSGSPFDPVVYNGKTMVPSQVNNMFIFPGLGLGASLCGAKHISQGIVYATSLTLANSLTTQERDAGQIFPSVNRIRDISHSIAMAVIRQAANEGLANVKRLDGINVDSDEELATWVSSKMYDPVYVQVSSRSK